MPHVVLKQYIISNSLNYLSHTLVAFFSIHLWKNGLTLIKALPWVAGWSSCLSMSWLDMSIATHVFMLLERRFIYVLKRPGPARIHSYSSGLILAH